MGDSGIFVVGGCFGLWLVSCMVCFRLLDWDLEWDLDWDGWVLALASGWFWFGLLDWDLEWDLDWDGRFSWGWGIVGFLAYGLCLVWFVLDGDWDDDSGFCFWLRYGWVGLEGGFCFCGGVAGMA